MCAGAAASACCGLFQIGVDEVDEVFGEVGRDLLLGAVDEVETDVGFKHLAHESVDAAADCGEEHELVAAIGFSVEGAFDGIELAANFAEALQKLEFFPFVVGHFSSARIPLPGIVYTGRG